MVLKLNVLSLECRPTTIGYNVFWLDEEADFEVQINIRFSINPMY